MEINTYYIIIIGSKIKLQNLFEQSQQILITLTSVIQVQLGEGKSLDLDWATIKDVKHCKWRNNLPI